MKYILETSMGDKWEYENEEDAQRDKYIFGGKITPVEEKEAAK